MVNTKENKETTVIQILNEKAGLQNDLSTQVFFLLSQRKLDKATELICQEIKKRHHIYTTREDTKSEVWIYDNGIYIPKGRSYIREFVRNILGRAYTDTRSNHVISKIEVDTYIEPKDFFVNDNLNEICVRNGILNLEKKELSSFTPDKFFFNKLPITYDKECKCPKIEKFLKDILKNESDAAVVFELFGFSLYREYFIEKAFMFVGDGRNGKSKLLELLKRFVGPENTCSVHLNSMKYDASAVCELLNRLLNIGGDLNPTSLKETGLFKQLSGRDTVQAKRKYLKDLIFQNYAKHVFACNELPKVYDQSRGFWDRWVLLEFPYTFVDKEEYSKLEDKTNFKLLNPTIIDEISTDPELSGLLNLAIQGLQRLKQNKDFSYTQGSAAVKEFWMRKSNSFSAFCMDCVVESTLGHVTKEQLKQKYVEYRKKHDLKKGESDQVMKRVLVEMFGADEQRKSFKKFGESEHDFYYEQKRVWVGIALK